MLYQIKAKNSIFETEMLLAEKEYLHEIRLQNLRQIDANALRAQATPGGGGDYISEAR